MTMTADTVPYSSSKGAGTTRWDISAAVTQALAELNPQAELVGRAYLMDCAAYKLPGKRWFGFSLIKESDIFRVTVFHFGPGDAQPVTGDAARAAVAAAEIVMQFRFTLADFFESDPRDSFERVVANVMHKQLEPTTTVMTLWERILRTGTIQRPRPPA